MALHSRNRLTVTHHHESDSVPVDEIFASREGPRPKEMSREEALSGAALEILLSNSIAGVTAAKRRQDECEQLAGMNFISKIFILFLRSPPSYNLRHILSTLTLFSYDRIPKGARQKTRQSTQSS